MSSHTDPAADLSAQKRALFAIRDLKARIEAMENARREPIAVVGMSCRFPGAADLDEFWRLLDSGGDAIDVVPADRWNVDEFYDPDPEAPGKTYCREGGFIGRVDGFDATLFGISPREIVSMDPQQRLLLEVSWEALEHAGIAPGQLGGSPTGVFVGLSTHDYSGLTVHHPDLTRIDAYMGTGGAACVAAGRISYLLGLHGPALAVDTACSSALVAVEMAVGQLRTGKCDMALAGGVSLMLSPKASVYLSKLRAVSPTNRCHAFAAAADGYVRGEGCGMIVLKRLSDAQRDSDRILAVIRGAALNHDGRSSGLTVPNGAAQEAVIRKALADANVEPAQVQYIEAHGTGTPLGDPIEMRALAEVLGADRQQPFVIGTVKTNIGHLEAAAGIAGLIKVVLAMQHRTIPRSLHFNSPSQHIAWDQVPVTVATTSMPWPNPAALPMAGVSAFGFSGTNAHVILEAAPAADERAAPPVDRPAHLLTISAPNRQGVTDVAVAYARHLDALAGESVLDAAYTANVGRTPFEQRAAVVFASGQELGEQLRTLAAGPGATPDVVTGRALDPDARKLAFLFTGQGAQYAQMGRDLYDASPVFRQAIDDCDAIITERTGRSLLPIVFPTAPDSNAINETGWTQPALFSIEYALAQLWRSWGIEPAVVMGHSLGEYVAACVAGLFDLKDALSLVITRATLMQAMPAGGRMVAVMAPEADVAAEVARVGGALAVAAVNGPSNTVVSGAAAAVEALIAASAARGWTTQALVVSHAFHSPLMDPALAGIGAAAGAVTFLTPTIRIISNLTGTVAQPGALARADYWIDHTRRPVRFADSVKAAATLGCTHFLEIGPHPTLLALAGQTLADGSVKMLPSLRRGGDGWRQMLRSAASLWVDGYPIDWARFDAAYGRQRVALPTYPFQRQRYWVETAPVHVTGAAASSSLLGDRVSSPAFPQTMYQSVVDGESLQILGDHVIYGNPIFPAMGYVELARQAGQAVLGLDSPRVCDLSIEEPLTVPGGERRLMQIVLNKDGDRNATFQVFSRAAEDDSAPWARHATGRVDNARPEECDQPVDRLRERCPRAIDMSTYYEQLSERGLAYGPSFRAIESMWAGEGEAIARLRMPITAAPGYDAHPGYLDAALQVLGALFAGAGQQSGGDVFLPVGIPQLAIAQPLPATVTSYARLQGTFDPKADVLKADVFWIDESGVTVLSAPGIVVKRASGAAVKRAAEKRVRQWMHHVVWEPAAVDADNAQTGPASYMVVGTSSGDGGAVVRALKDRGRDAVLVDVGSESAAAVGRELERVMKADTTSRLRVVAYVAGDRTQADRSIPQDALARALVADALTIVQACSHPSGDRSQVYFVTRGGQAAGAAPYDVAPAQAALWGFARSARLEHPELACVSVDLDPSGVRDNVSALADELTSRSHEDQIAYRGGSRLAARLVQGDGRALSDAPLTVPDAPSFRLSTTSRGVLDNLFLEPQERRQPGAGEVEIEVEAAGVNFRDVLNALGMYPGDPGPMGGECAGRVVSVGAGVTTVRVGDDVFCLAGGSFSRFVVAQERAVARRPAGLTAVQASSLPLTFLTVYHGLHHLAGIKPGQRVLVHAAAGGVGLSAIQVARAAGAEVYGTAGSPEKQDYVRSLGVKAVFSSRTADFEAGLMAATGGEGVDVVLNSLTGEFIPASLRVLRKGGTFLEIGKAEIWTGAQLAAVNPHVHYKPFDLGDVILTDLDRIAAMFKDVLAGLATGALGPLPVRVFDMTDARSAFRFMAQARHFGKIVLRAPRLTSRVAPGAYIVTGGTGGLGVRVAQHLAERGVRHLILAARSEPGAAALSLTDALRVAGTRVEVVRADVGTADGVARLLAAVDAAGVPLSGVVHAAGVLDDGVIREQTPARFERVMSPKVDGAWLLDRMTRGRSLEQFVMFSSVASLLGSPGQANYAAANGFLDGLAHRRHARGETATSINWGPWADIGMAARLGGRSSGRLDDTGFGTIAADFGLVALDLATSADIAQVGVFPANWDRIVGRFAAGAEPAFLRTLAAEVRSRSPQADGQSSTGIRQLLSESADPGATMVSFLRRHVAAALGLSNPERLDVATPLTNVGLDSLMALELRNRLSSELAVTLAPTLLFEFPTIKTLADHLNALLLLGPTPAASVTDTDSSVDAMTDEQVDAMLARLLEESQGKR